MQVRIRVHRGQPAHDDDDQGGGGTRNEGHDGCDAVRACPSIDRYAGGVSMLCFSCSIFPSQASSTPTRNTVVAVVIVVVVVGRALPTGSGRVYLHNTSLRRVRMAWMAALVLPPAAGSTCLRQECVHLSYQGILESHIETAQQSANRPQAVHIMPCHLLTHGYLLK